MGKHTPLYACHKEMGGKIVDFAGWELPIHYGSQVQEHHQVRNDAGMFDVSHMTVVDIKGEKAKPFLQHLFANDVDRLKTSGKALYSCMLNEEAGVIDDLITYYLNDQWFRVVVNAATREKDLKWINQQASAFGVEVIVRDDLVMIAVQGPKAREKAASLFSKDQAEQALALKPFNAVPFENDWFVARTGYTGEDGFEVMLPETEAAEFWNGLASAGVKPCGLGARDTLRLEAGMNLYGTDMDESTSPLESGLAWTIAWEPNERDFIGRTSLESQRSNHEMELVGLVLEDRGVLRGHQKVITERGEGETTSGTFSPTLEKSIAFARIPKGAGEHVQVEIRNKKLSARVVKPPFVRNGKACIDI